jgi:hypothetical protein
MLNAQLRVAISDAELGGSRRTDHPRLYNSHRAGAAGGQLDPTDYGTANGYRQRAGYGRPRKRGCGPTDAATACDRPPFRCLRVHGTHHASAKTARRWQLRHGGRQRPSQLAKCGDLVVADHALGHVAAKGLRLWLLERAQNVRCGVRLAIPTFGHQLISGLS